MYLQILLIKAYSQILLWLEGWATNLYGVTRTEQSLDLFLVRAFIWGA